MTGFPLKSFRCPKKGQTYDGKGKRIRLVRKLETASKRRPKTAVQGGIRGWGHA